MKLMLNPSPRPAVLPTRASRYRTGLLTGLLLLGTTLVGTAFAQSTTAVPKFLSYQGKVTDASGTPIGDSSPVNRTVIFRIWSDATGVAPADLVYSEQQTVTISNGEFSALIGQGAAVSGTPLGFSEDAVGEPNLSVDAASVFSGAARYLGVTIDDGSGSPDAEISPRQRLVTSAYAMRAKVAESLSTGATDALRVADDGKVGVGVTSPSANLHVQGDIRSGAAGTQAPQVTLMASSDTIVALTMGYANGTDAFSPAAVAGDSVIRTDNNGKLILQSGVSEAGMVIDQFNDVYVTHTLSARLLHASSNRPSHPTGGAWLEWDKQGAGKTYLLNQKNTGSGGIVFGEVDSANSWDEHMVITGTGRVGIDTDSPSAPLGVRAGSNGPHLAAEFASSDLASILEVRLGRLSSGLTGPLLAQLEIPGGTGHLEVNEDFSVTGKVGIGTNSPPAALSVRPSGSTRVAEFATSTGYTTLNLHVGNLFGDTSGNNRAMFDFDGPGGTDGMLGVQDNFAVQGRLAIGNGNVFPAAPLSVRGEAGSTKVAEWASGPNAATILNLHLEELWGGEAAQNQAMFDIVGGTNGFGAFGIKDNLYVEGNVGIGQFSPRAALDVERKKFGQYIPNYRYVNSSESGNGGPATSEVSIWASGRIVTQFELNVTSDERIKNIVGPSSGPSDLATVMELEVTDYRYIDTVANGDQAEKKVIAQQVEQVYPLAVDTHVGVIPDIFEMATMVEGWIQLETDLVVGDRVQLIAEADGQKTYEVTAVDDGRFKVNRTLAGDEVFVYGREVDDLRTVDYDALAMLNISATQEIKREKDAEISALTDIVEDLLERVAELEAKLGEK